MTTNTAINNIIQEAVMLYNPTKTAKELYQIFINLYNKEVKQLEDDISKQPNTTQSTSQLLDKSLSLKKQIDTLKRKIENTMQKIEESQESNPIPLKQPIRLAPRKSQNQQTGNALNINTESLADLKAKLELKILYLKRDKLIHKSKHLKYTKDITAKEIKAEIDKIESTIRLQEAVKDSIYSLTDLSYINNTDTETAYKDTQASLEDEIKAAEKNLKMVTKVIEAISVTLPHLEKEIDINKTAKHTTEQQKSLAQLKQGEERVKQLSKIVESQNTLGKITSQAKFAAMLNKSLDPNESLTLRTLLPPIPARPSQSPSRSMPQSKSPIKSMKKTSHGDDKDGTANRTRKRPNRTSF